MARKIVNAIATVRLGGDSKDYKAGKDEAAFRAVDQDLVVACGRAAKAAGIRQMIAISSVGADMMAKNFYLKVKGETEQALGRIGLQRLDVLRPGLLRRVSLLQSPRLWS